MNRRDFLHNLSHAAAVPSMFSGLDLSSILSSSPLFSNTNKKGKILILIKLEGGNDGLNTLIPLDQYSGLNYIRPDVVLPENSILNINSNDLGFHPSLTFFKELFNQERLKIIQSVAYPTPNYSHFRSMDIWESASDANIFESSGWMGRYLENLHPNYPGEYPNENFPDPLALELGNSHLSFTGRSNFTSIVTSNPERYNEIFNPLNYSYPNTKYGEKLSYLQLIGNQANNYNERLSNVYKNADFNDNFPPSYFGDQLKVVAGLINAGLNTRIYSVKLGGFDTHDFQVDGNDHTQGAHTNLLKQLNDSIKSLMDSLDAGGNSDRVIGMIFSEFGRTVASNRSIGTDHGTAAPMFIFGNKVDSEIMGRNPIIPTNADLQYEMEMQYDFRQVYYSVIKQWLGGNEDTAENVLFKKFDQLPIIQAKYIDTDGDGVSDDRDLCNTTPLGAMVNTDGCEIFSLPADNYSIQTNGVSCSGKTNGIISISVSNTEHIYNLSIPETEGSYSLNSENEHQLVIDELEIGSYTLNFTVEGQEGYLQTFEIGITEPPALSAKSSVNQKGKTMTVKLSGSDLYYAEVNGDRRSYKLDNFTLQLRPGMNTVKISTPQDCQGIHVEQVFISEQVKHYPNPVQGELNLVIPGEDRETTVAIYSRSGSLIKRYQEQIPFSRIVTINTTGLRTDIYVVKVNGQTVEQTFKMIKR
ncbi:DUF1501 domain-containing protein [Flavobacteriaceae bacterium]|nr:DUF1501 domain-containing protein [Flavobacteriaceae bacterium]MDC6469386.1 DUF1501 domain-containing protein [Flavobacteriaceae bacterium]